MRRGLKIVLLLTSFLLLLCSSNAEHDEIHFTRGQPHNSTKFPQYFELMTVTQGPCTLSIQADLYNTNQALELYYAVFEDLHRISTAANLNIDALSPFTLYIVKDTPHGIEQYDNLVYCTSDAIDSEEYLTALVSVVLDLEDYWKAYGFSSYIQNLEADEVLLISSYRELTDLDSLSLFIAYFVEPFATPKEIHLAQQTAIALSRYIINYHDVTALLREDCGTFRKDWLKSIGIDRHYEDPLSGVLSTYRFSYSSYYPLIATTELDHRFHLLPLDDMRSAKEVRRFLYDAAVGTQALLSFIKERAPTHYQRFVEQVEKKLDVYCSAAGGSYANYHQRKIQLQLSYGYLHELGHVLVPSVQQSKGYAITWQYEGLCEYFSYAIHPAHALLRSYTYNVLSIYSKTGNAAGNGKSPNADNRAFWARVTEIYLEKSLLPSDPDLLDLPLFIRAMAEAPIRYPEELSNSLWSIPIDQLRPFVPGNELTYAQAFCFASYLIDQYSLSTYLDYCAGLYSFEEVYSSEYQIMMEQHFIKMHNYTK